MAPHSPTHAFDPTPALEYDPGNFPPLNPSSNPMEMSSDGAFPKGVRFSDAPPVQMQARHSIATTNVPLLPAVSSASQIPRHGFHISNATSEVDITAYMEQCQLINKRLRESHESERKAWDIERTALKARIGELERKISRSKDPKRRSSNDSSGTNLHAFRADFKSITTAGHTRTRSNSESDRAHPPVWAGPENHPPATRVFSHEEDGAHLPVISENEALPPLSKEISPTAQIKVENVPVPIEQVDKTLDGITLKSAALTSTFDTGITSPQFASPAHTPSPQPRRAPDGLLQVDVNTLLSPLDEKLKRYAGHTPMIFDGTLSSGNTSTNILTPRQEKPIAPAPTKRPPLRPAENSDSYFSFTSAAKDPIDLPKEPLLESAEAQPEPEHETRDDPALQGPLMLDSSAKSEAANAFLEKVDAKLSEEAAHRSRYDSVVSEEGQEQKSTDVSENAPAREAADDDMPKLKIKNSMNFGSAWGGGAPGRI
ncbi:hypothetical protein PV11_00878 [Exophiala sideris]|uniref:Uncharacterized protein n=1 Tax=Exophiala sideris TaxID=1016849 RepID=A0A0D1XB77_9EURO|nr:hypothetical protein PV11_00878 [Exophiala sideris]